MAPIKHNLVALGSAAVLSVYAAGYTRTRAAAQAFADEAPARRPAPPASTNPPPAPPVAEAAATKPAASSPEPVVKRPASAKKSIAHDSVTRRMDSSTAPTPLRPAAATNSTPAQPLVVPKDSVSKAPPPVTDTATADKDHVAYKDGMYTGWGTSRHGDIQATVMIKEGKIVGAVISECLTQYSCSWISALPQQVLDRQSAEVDFVSGATQSTNAFYYAVLNALKKAK